MKLLEILTEGIAFWIDDDYDDFQIDLNNRNARIMLDLMGIDYDDYDPVGSIEHNEIPIIIRKLIKFKNDPSEIEKYIIEPHTKGGEEKFVRDIDKSSTVTKISGRNERGLDVHVGGLDSSMLIRKIDQMINILKNAYTKSKGVNFG